MDNSQDRIDELKSKIDDNNIDLKQIFQSAGERIAVPGVFKNENEEIANKLSDLSNLEKRLAEIDIKVEDLRNSFGRISEISDREKDIGEEYSLLEKENRKLFLPIGEASYRGWKENPSDEHKKLMTSLKDLENKITEFDDEIFELENNETKKSIIKKIKEKSRISMLVSRKKSRQLSMNNLYKKTGEKIYKKDLSYFENMENESVHLFINNRKKLEKLDQEMKTLKEETVRIEKHLKNAFSSGRQHKAEEKLRSERDFVLSEKMTQLDLLGKDLYNKKLTFDDENILTFFKDIDEILEKNKTINHEIDKCKAEIEIIKLDEEINDMKNNIKELQFTIEKCESDISEFNKEIKRAKAEIRKLKKIAEDDPQ